MGDGVMLCFPLVAAGSEDLPVAQNDRPDRDLSPAAAKPGEAKGATHDFFVFSHGLYCFLERRRFQETLAFRERAR
jgi:hypothetical protein